MMDDVTQHLNQLRRRMMTQLFVERLTWCALAFAAVCLLGAAVNGLRHQALWDAAFLWGMATVALVSAALWTWLQRLSLEQTASRVDQLGQTRDRFLTAFSFSGIEARTPMQTSALEECGRFIGSFDGRPLIKLRIPSQAAWLLVPLVAAGLLTWHARIVRDANQPDAATQQAIAEKARELEKLAKQIDKKNEELKSDDLKKIAEQLRKSVEHLQAQKTDDANKAALRELSSLEAMIQQMQKSPPSPEELAALADALKQNQSTKDAAAAMQAGKLGKAAEKLEALAQQPRDKSEAEKLAEQLAKAMRKAMSRLSANQQSELAKQMAKLSQSVASGQQSSEALQKLAQMLKQMAQQPSQNSDGDAKSQALRNALSALQNMKYGNPQDKAGDNAKDGEGKIVMQSFTGANPSQPIAGDPSSPSGQPGSEHDEGTTKTPFGDKAQRPGDKGAASQLNGALGEGESLHDMISTTGDTSKSNRRYRDLYNAMAPAAEDAILQENIPLGSRFFVKRYFENIRPKQ